MPGSTKRTQQSEIELRVPKNEGPYRLFVFVEDGHGHVGTANIPFYALPRPEDSEQARGVEFKKLDLEIPNRN